MLGPGWEESSQLMLGCRSCYGVHVKYDQEMGFTGNPLTEALLSNLSVTVTLRVNR